jgi:hypothetical protein
MPSESDSDQELDEVTHLVDEVLAGFSDLLPADLLGESRELLLDVVAAHPLGRLLAERLRELPPNDRSQEQRTAGPPVGEPDKEQVSGERR